MGPHSTLIASQPPVEHWHEYLNDPTFVDAILDRIVHQSNKLKLEGEYMLKPAIARKAKDKLIEIDTAG